MLEAAWWHAALQRGDAKKFPQKPSLLWDKESDRQTPVMMAKLALMMASNGQEFAKEHNLTRLLN
jgi:hypothetical protein